MALVVFCGSLSGVNPWFFGGCVCQSVRDIIIRGGLRGCDNQLSLIGQIFGTVFYVAYVTGQLCSITGTARVRRNGRTYRPTDVFWAPPACSRSLSVPLRIQLVFVQHLRASSGRCPHISRNEMENDAARERSYSSGPRRASSLNGAATSLNLQTHTSQAVAYPVEYLNSLLTSEQALSQNLPQLQEVVRDRLSQFDETISLALSRQSEMSEKTLQVLPQGLASVKALQHRVLLVKEKAIESERAVFSITSDMKRLDSAKRHLQRTITTLKRLHMLVHAVEQLRQTTVFGNYKSSSSFAVMDFRSAAQLVEATRLLLEYFDAYTSKVEPMMLLSLSVSKYQEALIQNLKRCFRIVGFGSQSTIQLEASTLSSVPNMLAVPDGGRDDEVDDDERRSLFTIDTVPSGSDLEGGVLLMDALGDGVRSDFVQGLCHDYLRNYVKDFDPPVRHDPATKKRVNSFKAIQSGDEPAKSLSGLAEMEQRFNWFQDVLQNAVRTFPMVPPRWNLMTNMSRCFLQIVRTSVDAFDWNTSYPCSFS
jgi:Vps53-like, N-terminal